MPRVGFEPTTFAFLSPLNPSMPGIEGRCSIQAELPGLENKIFWKINKIMVDVKILEELSNAFGPPGFEDEVRELMKKHMRKYVDSIEVDSFGNLICVKKGKKPRIMIAAHMDEIGFSVKFIDKNGFLKLARLGSVDARLLPGCKLKIRTKKGFVSGIIGCKPSHLLKEEERKKAIEFEELFVDIGAKNEEDAKKIVELGNPAVFDEKFTKIGNYVGGKAFDDRIGCAALIEIAKFVKKLKPTVYLVATTQEEVGLKGARVVGYRLEPDLCLVVDTEIAGDHPGIKEGEAPIKIGKGPCISLVEAGGRGTIMSPLVRELLMSAVKSKKIPYQVGVNEVGMTDATIVQLTKEGIPAGSIGIPTRYIHTPFSIADLRDLELTVKLVVEAVKKSEKFF